ncbi:hypothetical protein [Planctobacterium marinum]|uniref:hypothetical protein n=1 Tax=Planctobacterium marinum TaxID=1631968 RepID=UPI001E440D49|nr:hypothetical protein [Planctobacterium marinum]MCC2607449.1 hypothetical protein [Planctobacterium marinum]
MNNLFARSCPCCGKSISFSERLIILNREVLACKFCARCLKPNFKIMLFNMFWFSMSVSWFIKSHTSLGYVWALCAAVFAATVVLPALDLLFSLEEETFDELN